MTPKKASREETRLFEVPKPIEHDQSLPPLPTTPSPPRRRNYYHRQGIDLNNKFADLLRDEYYYDEQSKFNQYNQSLHAPFDRLAYQNNANDYYQKQQWPRYDYSNDKGANYNGSYKKQVNDDKENEYDRFGGGYSSSNYNQKAPRFQMETNRNFGSHRKQSTTQCKYWSNGAVCKHGKACKFSHFSQCDNQRKRVTNYKTKPCVDPGRGFKCEYGDRCNFAHPGQALRRPMPIQYQDKQYFKV